MPDRWCAVTGVLPPAAALQEAGAAPLRLRRQLRQAARHGGRRGRRARIRGARRLCHRAERGLRGRGPGASGRRRPAGRLLAQAPHDSAPLLWGPSNPVHKRRPSSEPHDKSCPLALFDQP